MTASSDFFEVVSTTRSVRRKLDFERAVEPAVLERCIDAAVQAPTGLDREAWRFLVLTEQEPKSAVARLYLESFNTLADRFEAERPAALRDTRSLRERPTYASLAENLGRMPALILVCSKGRPDPTSTAMQVAFFGSVLPAAWSLMMALRAEGLGATWTSLLVSEEERVAAELGIPEDVTQTILLPVAYTKGARLRPAKRKPAAQVTYWNRWSQSERPSSNG